jgi:hypothetical protein
METAVVITWKISSIFTSGKTSNSSTKIDIFREMAYKEVIPFCSTVTVLFTVEERCEKKTVQSSAFNAKSY